jgi:hypothetical protein
MTITRYVTSEDAMWAALPHHPQWRRRGDVIDHNGWPLSPNQVAERFSELGWIEVHGDGEGGLYWTVETEQEDPRAEQDRMMDAGFRWDAQSQEWPR